MSLYSNVIQLGVTVLFFSFLFFYNFEANVITVRHLSDSTRAEGAENCSFFCVGCNLGRVGGHTEWKMADIIGDKQFILPMLPTLWGFQNNIFCVGVVSPV